MTKLQDIARVTVRGSKLDREDETTSNAHLLWLSVQRELDAANAAVTGDGRYRFLIGTLKLHVQKLWPTLSAEERDEFSKPLYAFLRANGICVCTNRGNPVTWKVALKWPDHTASQAVSGFAHTLTRREKQLTPEEAGETLEPAPVTIRHCEPHPKKEDAVTTTDRSIHLTEHHERARAIRDQRRADVTELFTLIEEPVTIDEIAHFVSAHPTTIKGDVKHLMEQGVLFSRQETAVERARRYGESISAKQATLYWNSPRIPERVSRVVIDGYVAEYRRPDRHLPTSEINRKLWSVLKRKGPRSKFTVISLVEAAGLPSTESVRTRVREMTERGLLVEDGYVFDGGRRTQYRLGKHHSLEQIREFLGQPAGSAPEPEITVTYNGEPVTGANVTLPPVPAPPTSAEGDYVPLSEVHDLIAELKRLRARVAELEEAAQTPALRVTSIRDLLGD